MIPIPPSPERSETPSAPEPIRPDTPARTLPDQVICIHCGYSLARLPRHGDCPECGRAIAASIGDLDRAKAAVGPDGVVTRGICRRCEYPLAGLKASGVCPECGFPIAQSLSDFFASRNSVLLLARATTILSWANFLAAPSLVVLLVVLASHGAGDFHRFAFGLALVQSVGFFGSWLLATPEIGTQDQRSSITSIRGLVIIEIIAWILFASFDSPLGFLGLFVILVTKLSRAIAISIRLRWIAERSGDFEASADAHASLSVYVTSAFLFFLTLIPAWLMMHALLVNVRHRLRNLAMTMPHDEPGASAGDGGTDNASWP